VHRQREENRDYVDVLEALEETRDELQRSNEQVHILGMYGEELCLKLW